MIKPNFLIVGAAKCGTTSLYYYLKQHPDIGFPKLKEPKYFSTIFNNLPQKGKGDNSIDDFAIDNWDTYLSLFENIKDKKCRGEASPDYLLYHENTASVIKEKLGDIPIIIMLRNPVNRAFSAYSNMIRDNREFLSFKEAIEHEEIRKNNNWDFMWRYLESSLYSEQVMTFKTLFTNVKIVLFEDFVQNPSQETNSVIEFLGLVKLTQLTTKKYNPSGVPKNIFAKFLLNRNNTVSTTFRELLKQFVPRRVLEYISSKSLKKLILSQEDSDYVYNLVKEDILKTEKIIQKDLSSWK